MPAADDREAIPAGLEIHYQPRQPEFDPTLNIEVRCRSDGSAAQPAGDHRRLDHARFHEWGDLPHRPLVAGDRRVRTRRFSEIFRRPVYEPPTGPGGIPLDIERALRSFEARFGSKADWYEYVGVARWLHGYLDKIEDYWERGDGTKTPPAAEILHNLAIYGWDLRDTLSLTATKVRRRIGRRTGRRLVPEAEGRGRQRPSSTFRARDRARARQPLRSHRSAPRACWASRALTHPTRAGD